MVPFRLILVRHRATCSTCKAASSPFLGKHRSMSNCLDLSGGIRKPSGLIRDELADAVAVQCVKSSRLQASSSFLALHMVLFPLSVPVIARLSGKVRELQESVHQGIGVCLPRIISRFSTVGFPGSSNSFNTSQLRRGRKNLVQGLQGTAALHFLASPP
jgi:hypothetical protein